MASRKASCRCGKLSVTYEGPDPERISLCQCYECQKKTGSVLSVQARIPREQVTIQGQSTMWTFPVEGGRPAEFRSCDSGGATYHFCPECGSTVYWDISVAPDVVGGRSRRLPRPGVSAADDLRLRGVRASVGDEPLSTPPAERRVRRCANRSARSVPRVFVQAAR